MGAEGARRANAVESLRQKDRETENTADFLFILSFIPEPPILSVTFLFFKKRKEKKKMDKIQEFLLNAAATINTYRSN